MPVAASAAEIAAEILVPAHLAVPDSDANEIAILADGVDAVAVHGRGAAKVAARRADLRGPETLPVLAVQGK